jgi:hypothetical protein
VQNAHPDVRLRLPVLEWAALSCGEAFFVGRDPQTMTVVKNSPD